MTKEQLSLQLQDREFARTALLQRQEELERKIQGIEQQIVNLKVKLLEQK